MKYLYINNKGPRTEPCGTPWARELQEDLYIEAATVSSMKARLKGGSKGDRMLCFSKMAPNRR